MITRFVKRNKFYAIAFFAGALSGVSGYFLGTWGEIPGGAFGIFPAILIFAGIVSIPAAYAIEKIHWFDFNKLIEAAKPFLPADSKEGKGEKADLFEKADRAVQTLIQTRLLMEKKFHDQEEYLHKQKEKEVEQRKELLNSLWNVHIEKHKAETLARIVEDAQEAIIGQSIEGTITSWNKGAEQLYGYTESEVKGKSIKVIVPIEKHIEIDELLLKMKKGVAVQPFQTVQMRKNGSSVDVSVSVSPIKGPTGGLVGISILTVDITKEKEIDRAKTEFVSLASHQLRTPLSTVNWYAEMLLAGDAGPVSDEQRGFLSEIYEANQRMVILVNALLDVSRIDMGTFIIEPEPSVLGDIAEHALGELQQKIQAKHLTIEKLYSLSDKVNVDPKLMHMVFQNLLSNAAKYSRENGKIFISIGKSEQFVEGLREKEKILITVTDDGIGIPEGARNKIFSKLFRADNAKEREAEGTGLGLYLVRSIAEHSGGKCWFVSEENKGTTFFLALPIDGMTRKAGEKQLSS